VRASNARRLTRRAKAWATVLYGLAAALALTLALLFGFEARIVLCVIASAVCLALVGLLAWTASRSTS
jgi:hypothetical protein